MRGFHWSVETRRGKGRSSRAVRELMRRHVLTPKRARRETHPRVGVGWVAAGADSAPVLGSNDGGFDRGERSGTVEVRPNGAQAADGRVEGVPLE
ncbi:pollen-specific leucine-rich repeat extensin-like protein 4 [Iris pallida]|uniref:Pollen-specific leucine-rich repeat extensin-like protein 4 n=1 Tax=Iris pallida TaxID=29817 RepID=A0AAX6GT67_IRIPA|nr:pollen-specific leucine-rich repeat extensin-like protein 4 [Iris pallida]